MQRYSMPAVYARRSKNRSVILAMSSKIKRIIAHDAHLLEPWCVNGDLSAFGYVLRDILNVNFYEVWLSDYNTIVSSLYFEA